MHASREWIKRAGARTAASVLAAALLGLPPAAAAAELAIKAGAGLDGVTKPGRWTPVRIVIQSAEPIQAELVVDWGATSLRRPLEIAAGATQQFEIYLQTMEVGAEVSVRVVSSGGVRASATAPVRTLRADEPFTVCVASGGTGESSACTARPAPDALPRSLRGYDAADRVVWDDDGSSLLAPEQRAALAQWRALRALDNNGSLSATDRPRSIMPALARKSRTGTVVHLGMGLYVMALLTASLVAARPRVRGPVALGTIGLLVIAGTASALAAGRTGGRSSIVIHHATLVQQLAGASGSIVTMQGAAEYPAYDTFTVHALLSDAAFAPAGVAGRNAVHTIDENGYPVIGGTFGLGSRQPFTLYGVSDFQPLTVRRRGDLTLVTNSSSEDLTGCRFGDGTAVEGGGVLRTGVTVSAALPEPIVGPVITCSLASPPVTFTAATRNVHTAGTSTLAAYLSPSGHEPH